MSDVKFSARGSLEHNDVEAVDPPSALADDELLLHAGATNAAAVASAPKAMAEDSLPI
jgi:hypothetical protein